MKKSLLLLAASTVFSLLLLEAGIGLATKLGWFPIKVPTYSIKQARSPIFWRDVNPDFGVWHLPNVTTRHSKSCFDVTYRTNSHGARDAERTLDSGKPRIVVLGDSMTEGVGVADVDRYTDVLERESSIEHLNFGTGGNFGNAQQYLLYKTLASRFSHAAVLIGMIPDNDFWDNDYEFGKEVYRDRYRPYLVGRNADYRVVYHLAALEQSVYRDRGGWLGQAQRLLAEFTYTYNAAAYFRLLIKVRTSPDMRRDHMERTDQFFKSAPGAPETGKVYSGYYDYRDDQLDLVKYAFAQIKQLASGRPVIIALLPTPADFLRYDPASTPRLSRELGEFAAASGMTLVDLLPDMHRQVKDWNEYILPCDGHWNARGHAAAARALKAALAPVYGRLAR